MALAVEVSHSSSTDRFIASITSLPTHELEYWCSRELEQFHMNTQYKCDERFGCELFRRAFDDQDERAWTSILTLYSPLVNTWIRQSSEASLLRFRGDSPSLVNVAFARFWLALSRNKEKQIDSLPSLMKYLKYCTRSVIVDEIRFSTKRGQEASFHSLVYDDTFLIGDSSMQVISNMRIEEFWEILRNEVHSEAEWAICMCFLYQEMKPREIYAQYRHLFSTIDDVYQVKRNVFERLRRNSQFLLFARQEGYALQHHSIAQKRLPQPLLKKEHVKKQVALSSDTHLAVSQEAKDVPKRSVGPLQQLIVLPSNETPPSDQTNYMLHQTQKELLRLLARREACILQAQHDVIISLQEHILHALTQQSNEQELSLKKTPPQEQFFDDWTSPTQQVFHSPQQEPQQGKQKVHYYQQMTMCSKERCKKCKEKIGHGPYWYCASTESGRTKTKYIGKFLPGQAPANIPERAKRLSTITYHQQTVYCNKKRCRKCFPGGPGHGPYWYAYQEIDGKLKRTYIGKQLVHSPSC